MVPASGPETTRRQRFFEGDRLAWMLLPWMIVMRNEALSQLSEVIEETGREISVAGRRSRGQLFALIGVTSFVLLAIIASAVASRLAPPRRGAWGRGPPGPPPRRVFGSV